MKRDLRLVRLLLLAIETNREVSHKTPIDHYSAEEVGQHLHLMASAGLIEIPPRTSDRFALRGEVRLTWEGADFLDACRSTKVWEDTLSRAAKVGSFTFDLLKQIMIRVIAEQLK